MATIAAGTRPPRTRTRKSTSLNQGAGRLAATLITPTFLVLALTVGYPIVTALRLAFVDTTSGVDPQTGIVQDSSRYGFGNFARIFDGTATTGSVTFTRSVINTTTYTVVGVIVETVIGVAMALIMARAFRGRALIRASILIPWAIPTAISALLWQWIFQADGVANKLLGTQILWTQDSGWSWLAVMIADTWKTAPFIGLLVLAGLQVIPAEVYEAAKVDGISAWNTFLRITLPLVKPALVVAVLFRMLDVMRMFDLPYLFGGLGFKNTATVSMLAFQEAVQNNRFGPAAAYSIVLFVYMTVIAFIFVKVLGADIIGANAGRRKGLT